MKYNIEFEIECGEKTCASEPKKFCKYAWFNMVGDCTCYLFDKKLYDDQGDNLGWIQRCGECITKAKQIN